MARGAAEVCLDGAADAVAVAVGAPEAIPYIDATIHEGLEKAEEAADKYADTAIDATAAAKTEPASHPHQQHAHDAHELDAAAVVMEHFGSRGVRMACKRWGAAHHRADGVRTACGQRRARWKLAPIRWWGPTVAMRQRSASGGVRMLQLWGRMAMDAR